MRPDFLERELAVPFNNFLFELKWASSIAFSLGFFLGLLERPSRSPKGLRKWFSTKNLTKIKAIPIGSANQRSLNLAKFSGLITMVLLITFSSLKVFQSTFGGSQMSGFQNQVDISLPNLIISEIPKRDSLIVSHSFIFTEFSICHKTPGHYFTAYLSMIAWNKHRPSLQCAEPAWVRGAGDSGPGSGTLWKW